MTNSIQIPNLKIVSTVGFEDQAYNEIKQAAKEEIPFRVNIRRCKRQYAYNAIDIRPHGKTYEESGWTEEEFDHVLKFVVRHGLGDSGSLLYGESKASKHLLYKNGFCYMSKIVKAYTENGEVYDLHKQNAETPSQEVEESEMNLDMERLADTFTEMVCEAGKRYVDMRKEEKVQLANELTENIENYNISLSESDMKYLEANYPVLHLIFSSKQETVENNEVEEIEVNEKQMVTLNTRLDKAHVKPLVLYKDSRTNSIVLECLNTNLENPSRFCFSIDESGVERGKGYAYPTDDLLIIKVFNDDSEQLEDLFQHDEVSTAQNKVINRMCNHWKDSHKYNFVSVHKTKGDKEQVILHIVNNEDDSDWYGRFNLAGHMVYSSNSLDQTFNPCKLIYEFNNPKLKLVVNN